MKMGKWVKIEFPKNYHQYDDNNVFPMINVLLDV